MTLKTTPVQALAIYGVLALAPALVSWIPVVGPILFSHDLILYFGIALVAGIFLLGQDWIMRNFGLYIELNLLTPNLVYVVIAIALLGGLIGLILSFMLAFKAHKGLWEGYPLLDSVGRDS